MFNTHSIMFSGFFVLVLLTQISESYSSCKMDYNRVFVNCTADRQCHYKGICDAGNCQCEKGYITFNAPIQEGCNYDQKLQQTALILAAIPFTAVFGADQFYLEHNDYGAGKLIYCVGTMLFAVTLFSCFAALVILLDCTFVKVYGSQLSGCGLFFLLLWFLGLCSWIIVDAVKTANCDVLDSNGAPLLSM